MVSGSSSETKTGRRFKGGADAGREPAYLGQLDLQESAIVKHNVDSIMARCDPNDRYQGALYRKKDKPQYSQQLEDVAWFRSASEVDQKLNRLIDHRGFKRAAEK